jgi:triosephosphate isomerase
MRRKLITGNWKMNGGLASNAALLSAVKSELAQPSCQVAVCAPAPYLAQCQQLLAGTAVAWGAQDVSAHDAGAYTGEISAAMLRDFDCAYVIVGHSERRAYHGEGDETVGRKAARAIAAGLIPIVCVGETLAEREAGQTEQVVQRQLEAVLAQLAGNDLGKLVVAYEPVWAIGTGKTATPQMAQDVHAFLRGRIAARDAQAASGIQIL